MRPWPGWCCPRKWKSLGRARGRHCREVVRLQSLEGSRERWRVAGAGRAAAGSGLRALMRLVRGRGPGCSAIAVACAAEHPCKQSGRAPRAASAPGGGATTRRRDQEAGRCTTSFPLRCALRSRGGAGCHGNSRARRAPAMSALSLGRETWPGPGPGLRPSEQTLELLALPCCLEELEAAARYRAHLPPRESRLPPRLVQAGRRRPQAGPSRPHPSSRGPSCAEQWERPSRRGVVPVPKSAVPRLWVATPNAAATWGGAVGGEMGPDEGSC